jgi:hypothetical protein
VQQVQVYVIEPGAIEGFFDGGQCVFIFVVAAGELRGDAQVRPMDRGLAHRFAHGSFVLVGKGAVEPAIARIDGPQCGLYARRAVELAGTEADGGDSVAVVEGG